VNLMSVPISVKSIDHVVLTVKSVEDTVSFYTKYLGMKHEEFQSPRDPKVVRQVLSPQFVNMQFISTTGV
jgi:Glyoxalase/Bleomycin resistance protein/Dioxygenase superfamily